MPRVMRQADVVALLRKQLESRKNQKAMAEELGVSPAYLNDVLKERRAPNCQAILDMLGLEGGLYAKKGKKP